MDFFGEAETLTQVCIIHKMAPRYYRYRYAIQIENLVFVY